MMKDLLSQIGTKVAAGAVGAILAIGGLGAAGIGPVSMISQGGSDHGCVELAELADNFEKNIVVCEVEPTDDSTTRTVEEDKGDKDSVAVTHTSGTTDDGEEVQEDEESEKGESLPIPTTTSEAAKIHAFDEACGNHGMYVSFFAQMGFEPPCALLARTGEEQDQTMTRQERKKATLQLRKECKARAKAGNPCTPEEFTSATTNTTTTDPAEESTSTTTTQPAEEEDISTTDTFVPDETEGESKGESKDKSKDKSNAKAKGGKGAQKDKGGKGGK